MTVFRAIAFNVLAYSLFLIMAVLGLPFLITRESAFWVARAWANITIWLMNHVAGIKLEVRGLEHLPDGGCIIAAKHQSALETFSAVPYLGQFAFILKRELNWVPLFGWYTSRTGMIPVNRGAKSAALRDITIKARQAIAEGRKIIIYPEGTRRPPGAPPEYKFGVMHLYSELDAPCVPMAVNSGLYWPRRSLRRYPGTATLEFLEPIPPGLDRDTFRTVLQDRIETATARLIAEARARGEGIPENEIAPPKEKKSAR